MEYALTALTVLGGGCILWLAAFGVYCLLWGEELMYR